MATTDALPEFHHDGRRMTWEESRWATLSPKFREAHNKRLVARGQQPIPAPKVDKYKPPPPAPVVKFDPSDKEFIAAMRQHHGGVFPGAHAQGEGLTINGQEISFGLNDNERKIERAVRAGNKREALRVAIAAGVEEGFTINGRSA